MAALEEGNVLSDVIIFEEEDRFSRETITISDGEVVVKGSILEADGDEYVLVATPASAAAIALEAASPDGTTAKIVALVRHCKVKQGGLDYNSEDEALVNAALKAKGILVVEEVNPAE